MAERPHTSAGPALRAHSSLFPFSVSTPGREMAEKRRSSSFAGCRPGEDLPGGSGRWGEHPKVSFLLDFVWDGGRHGQQGLAAAAGTEGWDAVTREGDLAAPLVFWENFPPYSRLCSKQGAAFCLESRGSFEGLFLLPTKHRSTTKHSSAPCQEVHFLQGSSNSISWESLSKGFVLLLFPFALG